jgi:hypothetical protein
MKKTSVAVAVAGLLSVAAVQGATAESSNISELAGTWTLLSSQPIDNFNSLLATFGSDLALIGRLDALSTGGELSVVGQKVVGWDSSGLALGDYVAVLGQAGKDGSIQAKAVLLIDEAYVPGATRVFIRSDGIPGLSRIGTALIGEQSVDLTSLLANKGPADLMLSSSSGQQIGIVGIQPSVGGTVLAEGIVGQFGAESSLGTGKVDGSLGTGKVDGSLGTGKVDGSLGTGKVDGSLGTGKVDGSLGTGKVDE